MNRFASFVLVLILTTCVIPAAVLPARAARGDLASYRWKSATMAPQGTGYAKLMEDFLLPRVEEATNGDLVIKVFWGGAMGVDEDYIRKMEIGQLQAAGLTARGVVKACPEFAVLELPFLFRNYEEVDYVRERMLPTFDALTEQHGYWLLGWIDQDFDQIYSTQRPLRTLEQYEKATFLQWMGPVEESLLRHLGTTAVEVPMEDLAPAIRQGQCDAMIGPGVWFLGSQLHPLLKSVNLAKIRYSPAAMICTQDAWQELPEKYKGALWEDRMSLTREFVKGVREFNKEFIDAILRYGVEEVRFGPEDERELRRRARLVWDDMAGEQFDVSLLEQILAHLAEFRNEKSVTVAKVEGKLVISERKRRSRTHARVTASADTNRLPTSSNVETRPAAPSPESGAAPRRITWQERVARIKAVQARLKEAGYYDMEIDGIIGSGTYNGILRYQRDHGLTRTGAINEELLEEMGLR
ncbi:MAG: TRAP transporter substrate-binding protein DctP [Desulfatibacillaceae bacterium]